MSTGKHYSKPPIREAIVDFRCPAAADESQEIVSRLENFASKFATEFPIRLNPKKQLPANNRSIVLGQKAKKFVLQIRSDGMLLSR